MARRHLGLSRDEWDGLDWLDQKTYLFGFEQEGLVTVEKKGSQPGVDEAAELAAQLGAEGPQQRQAAADADVIDLNAMKAELENLRGGVR
jgi:hypothetical protein